MKYVKSCGVVPYRRKEDGPEFLLVKHLAGHWGFPKGHLLVGESDLEAAVRELKEETGLEPKELDASTPFVERYAYKENEEIVGKTVVYFLTEVHDQPVVIQQSEIAEYLWAPFEKALQLLSHDESKNILTRANMSIVKAK